MSTKNLTHLTVAGFVAEAEQLIREGYVFSDAAYEYPSQGLLYEAVMRKGVAKPVDDNSPHVTITFSSFGDFAFAIQGYVANNYEVDMRDAFTPNLTHQFVATLHKREEIAPVVKFEDVEKQFVKAKPKTTKVKEV